MKKRLVLLMLVGMSLCVTACGSSNSETSAETTQVTEESTETEASEAETQTSETETSEAETSETEASETETQTSETETSETSEVETQETEASETEASETETSETEASEAETSETASIDEAKLKEMLTSVNNWVGMQFLYAENPDIQELSIAQAVPMAVHGTGADTETFESDEDYNLIIPNNILEESMKKLFGTTFNTAEYTPAEFDLVKKREDGTLTMGLGDWGLSHPEFSIVTVEKDTASDSFIATVNYFMHDDETNSDSDTQFVVRYTLTPNAESSYGFVITNMVGEKVATE